jgi:hypothetical protein
MLVLPVAGTMPCALQWARKQEESSMASLPVSASLSVEQLLEALAHLPPAEQREFHRRLTARQAQNGSQGPDEATLMRAARTRLPVAAERRLKRLSTRSERGQLTPQELADYQSLAQQTQRIDAARVQALAELARRRGQPVEAVLAEVDREGPTDDT